MLDRVGNKWSVLVLVLLESGSLRFTEIRRALDAVSQKVLTATLRGLERDGFLIRTVTATIPPRVDYALTVLGHDVLRPVATLAEWALAHRSHVQLARAAYDAASGARPTQAPLAGHAGAMSPADRGGSG